MAPLSKHTQIARSAWRSCSAAIFIWTSACLIAGCGAQLRSYASAPAVTASTQTSGPIVISRGGTYSGNWSSNNWQIPAVQINTNDPVVLRNATISSRGDLIAISRMGAGANVTIQNVTGTALDPGVAGLQRGSFVVADGIASLSVTQCTMQGVRFGVKVLSSSPSSLRVSNNVAKGLEDRASDGAGGFTSSRPDLGHFVMLNRVSASLGAEISWNQVVNDVNQNSTEDVINIYKSQGTASNPISVHDNYMEGNASPGASQYTGSGLITDGDSTQPETAFVKFANNEVVHSAGSGIAIATGHDIAATGNRIVSCGLDAQGSWFAAPFANAITVWNYYSIPDFGNINIQQTAGGMLRPASDGSPMVADVWVGSPAPNVSVPAQNFTDPCIARGVLTLSAEDDERSFWQSKLSQNHVTLGDQRTSNPSH